MISHHGCSAAAAASSAQGCPNLSAAPLAPVVLYPAQGYAYVVCCWVCASPTFRGCRALSALLVRWCSGSGGGGCGLWGDGKDRGGTGGEAMPCAEVRNEGRKSLTRNAFVGGGEQCDCSRRGCGRMAGSAWYASMFALVLTRSDWRGNGQLEILYLG